VGSNPLNSRELVERLWNDVRLREEVRSKTTVPELPLHEQLLHSQPLRFINTHWEGRFPDPDVRGAGPGPKRRIRRRLARFVIDLLADYMEGERQFNANVVRVSNAVSQGHDRLAGEVRQVAEAVRTESLRLADEFDTLHRLLESRVAALEEGKRPAS
jgi:hypothetical protein